VGPASYHVTVTERTPAEGLNRLEALIYADLYRYIDPTSRVAQVGWGMFFTIFHQVRAALTLHRDGVCFSAGPNRRTIIEYILALAWLADDGESVVDVLNRSLQNGQKLMATQLRKNSMLDGFPEQSRKILSETVAVPLESHPDERLLKPSNLIEMYDSTLKPYYAAESRFSHVSLTGIQFFIKDEGDDLTLSQMPIRRNPCPATTSVYIRSRRRC
jgi:hypothetical protein